MRAQRVMAVLVLASALTLSGCAMCDSCDDSAGESKTESRAGAANPTATAGATSAIKPSTKTAKAAEEPREFPVDDGTVEAMLGALEGAEPNTKNMAACAIIARVPKLYSPDISRGCRQYTSAPPSEHAMVIANAIQAPVAELGCSNVFRRMGTVPPAQRLPLFASGCPREGSKLPEADIAKAAPTGGMLAVILDGMAHRRGFADHKLHKALVAAFLTPVAAKP